MKQLICAADKMCIRDRIFNVQKYNMYDGPGIRTIVFFKGCPLRCKWCANPEGLERKIQIMFKKNSCVNCGLCVDACPVGIHEITPEGIHRVRRDIDCTGCGKCKSVCPQAALEVNGQVKTVSELLEIVEEDAAFYLSLIHIYRKGETAYEILW